MLVVEWIKEPIWPGANSTHWGRLYVGSDFLSSSVTLGKFMGCCMYENESLPHSVLCSSLPNLQNVLMVDRPCQMVSTQLLLFYHILKDQKLYPVPAHLQEWLLRQSQVFFISPYSQPLCSCPLSVKEACIVSLEMTTGLHCTRSRGDSTKIILMI